VSCTKAITNTITVALCAYTQGKPLEELNANNSQSISSALDFFGDNVQEDNSGIPTPDSPSETTKNKERKQAKRKRGKNKDPEEIQVKKSKLKSSNKYHCM